MASIQERILTEFCKRLEITGTFSPEALNKLRELLQQGKKVKAETLVQFLSVVDGVKSE